MYSYKVIQVVGKTDKEIFNMYPKRRCNRHMAGTEYPFDNRKRAFTVHSLLTILHETYHSIVFLEHDPSIYDGAGVSKR